MVKTIVFNGEMRSFESAPVHIGCRGCVAANASGDIVNRRLCEKLDSCVGIIYKEVTKEQDMTTQVPTQAQELINMTDKYTTRDGTPIRILCIDAYGEQPVVALHPHGSVTTHTETGSYWVASPGPCAADLIKVCPYDDFKKGDRVIAGAFNDRRIFSHVSSGKPYCFNDGGDEWTSKGMTVSWSKVRKPTAEELLA